MRALIVLAWVLCVAACTQDHRRGSLGDGSVRLDATSPDAPASFDADMRDRVGADAFVSDGGRVDPETGCLARRSNADRLDAPEMRMVALTPVAPPTLANVIIQQLIRDSLDTERMIWLLRLAISGSVATITTGHGAANGDGSFAFFAGTAPGPGDASRWDTDTLTGTISGEVVTSTSSSGSSWIPLYDEDGSLMLELPLTALRIVTATFSDDRSCIGTRGASRYSTDAGTLEAFITVADAREVPIDTSALITTLCNLLSGMASATGNCATPQDTWSVPPDSVCTSAGICSSGGCTPATCNAWRLQSGFAAHGVEITP